MPMDDSFRSNKRFQYTHDLLTTDISVASVKSVSNLTTTYDPPQVFDVSSDDTDTDFMIIKTIMAIQKNIDNTYLVDMME